MFENPWRVRQARNFTTNAPKILDLNRLPNRYFPENCRWVPLQRLYRHRNDPHHRNDLRHRNDTGGHDRNDPRNIGNGIKRTTKTGQQFSACFLIIYIASFLRCVIYLLPHFILQ